MPRSLARGDYSLVMAIESSSRPNSWYRVLAERQTGVLSCDCPPWVFNQNQDAAGQRFCPHTRTVERLVGAPGPAEGHAAQPLPALRLLSATQEQWPGLRGTWSMEERDAAIGSRPYHFVLVRLELGNGGTATGVVAFANRHHHSEAEMVAGVAGWSGYAIAAEVARLGGFPLAGSPPEHFRVDRQPPTGRRQRQTTQPPPTGTSVGLADILRVGDIIQPGRDPYLMAEQTLALFLGEEVYGQLERRGFLDVSSVRYASEQRVYRLRRDPAKRRERRIRVFTHGTYAKDFCIVAGQNCPSDDVFLTVFLGLLSDEDTTLSVVNPRYNIFPPYSDGQERETVPAVWTPRAMAGAALN